MAKFTVPLHPVQIELATAISKRFALAEDGDEHGAAIRRFTAVKIDKNKGSANGHVENTSPKTLMAITLKLITMAEKPLNPPC